MFETGTFFKKGRKWPDADRREQTTEAKAELWQETGWGRTADSTESVWRRFSSTRLWRPGPQPAPRSDPQSPQAAGHTLSLSLSTWRMHLSDRVIPTGQPSVTQSEDTFWTWISWWQTTSVSVLKGKKGPWDRRAALSHQERKLTRPSLRSPPHTGDHVAMIPSSSCDHLSAEPPRTSLWAPLGWAGPPTNEQQLPPIGQPPSDERERGRERFTDNKNKIPVKSFFRWADWQTSWSPA